MIRVDLTGHVFGRLTVLGPGPSTRGGRRWRCLCECGQGHAPLSGSLLNGCTKSCGCLRREMSRASIKRLKTDAIAERNGITETLVEKVTKFPAPPRELFAAVRDDWGSVGERRLWRALRVLVAQGRVVRVGAAQSSDVGYVRARRAA